MIKLSYWELLHPQPIHLSVGTIRKPTLSEISNASFGTYIIYEMLIGGDLEAIYNVCLGEEGKEYWDSLSEEDRSSLTIYRAIVENNVIQNIYTKMLNFFFCEDVIFKGGVFIVLNEMPKPNEDITIEQISGVINADSFPQLLNILRQICCIYEPEEPPIEEMKFKNELAKKLYLKMQAAKQKKKKDTATAKEQSLANIISAVSNMHPSLTPVTIWDLTKFQLIDSFNRMRCDTTYDIASTRMAVWGDKENKFDDKLWYKYIHYD